jgi:AcrR family transcriptional regulator
MGRIAGVTAEETRERLLQSAAAVFARKGYDGASIAEIVSESGLSSGAIYAHFGGKAELFAATLHAHGSREVDRLLELVSATDAAEVLRTRGVALAHRDLAQGSLLTEAIVAAKRHPDVARLMLEALGEREQRIAELIRVGQSAGAIDGGVGPDAVARFILMLALGSLLVAAIELPAVDGDEWSSLVGDLVARFTPR